MARFAAEAEERGISVIIAGAGGAAHLPGMVAAQTLIPVLGVPVESRTLKGLDSLLSNLTELVGGSPDNLVHTRKTG
jgi:5-(carboxyamino)imidazole ribonucleotide mutase